MGTSYRCTECSVGTHKEPLKYFASKENVLWVLTRNHSNTLQVRKKLLNFDFHLASFPDPFKGVA